MAGLSLFISLSGVVTYRSDSKTVQCKVELDPSPVQVMRIDYPKTLLYGEDHSFLWSRRYSGRHRALKGRYTGHQNLLLDAFNSPNNFVLFYIYNSCILFGFGHSQYWERYSPRKATGQVEPLKSKAVGI